MRWRYPPPAEVVGGAAGHEWRGKAADVVAGRPEAPPGAALLGREPGCQDPVTIAAQFVLDCAFRSCGDSPPFSGWLWWGRWQRAGRAAFSTSQRCLVSRAVHGLHAEKQGLQRSASTNSAPGAGRCT